MTSLASLVPDRAGPGFVSIEGGRFRPLVGETDLADWAGFAESWNHLGPDLYMADGGRFRRRRFARFLASPAGITRQPHGPHFQSRDYNRLNGGVDRWFEPVTEAIGAHPVTLRLLDLCRETFTLAEADASANLTWQVEMHQFRIEPVEGAPGKPTPEGRHRDGVDWVFVALIGRVGVAGGVTAISDESGHPLGSFTLLEPLDAVFLDDRRVRHAVTPIELLDPDEHGHRDVLVLTFRRDSTG